MNIRSTRTRRGAAILFSGALVLGGLVLAGEATAGEVVAGNPTCSSLGYTSWVKWDNNPSAGIYTLNRDGMDATLTVGTHPDKKEPNKNNAIVYYRVETAGGYAIIVKGGNGATVYGPGAVVPLHAPAVGALQKWPTISHFDLCWNKPAPQPGLGQLQVTKDVRGTDTPAAYQFEICVTPIAGGTQLCEKVVGEGTVTFRNLRPGDYVVTEKNPGPRFSVEGSGVTVTVKPDATATATVTNTWNAPSEEFGRVEVTKVVTGGDAPTGAIYRICLTGPDASTTEVCKTVRGQGTVSFDGLVPGIYRVTEPNAGGDYTATITPTTVDVTIGGLATAIVTNRYTEESLPPTPPEVLPPEVLPPEVLPPEVLPPTPEVLPPTPEVLPPTPITPAAPAAETVAAQTALPATGSEGGIAAIAAILVATGVALTLLGRQREQQQA
jgi:hypothetical protein